MAIILPQLWNGVPVFGADGLPIVDPLCCCVIGEECPYCLFNTFSATTAATIQFSGTVIPGDCTDCQSQMVGTIWELPKQPIDISGVWERCYYYLEAPLGCNVNLSGFDWMEFGWQAIDGLTLEAYLILHYTCDTGGGDFTWSTTYAWDVNNPNQHPCSTPFTIVGSTNADTGCTGYFPCDLRNLTANIGFI